MGGWCGLVSIRSSRETSKMNRETESENNLLGIAKVRKQESKRFRSRLRYICDFWVAAHCAYVT